LAGDLLAEPAALQVVAGEPAHLGLPEGALVVGGGLVEQLEEPGAAGRAGLLLRRDLLVLERHPEAVGEPFDGADEVEPLRLADERDHVALRVAAEAVVAAARRDREARRALLVERAAPDEPRALLAQRGALLDDRDQVGGRPHRLDGAVLDPRHQRLAAYDSAKRSVIPAMNSTASAGASPRPVRCA